MNSNTQHYIKSAWKNFIHNKWYISLMVFSLAIGMFCFIIASVYIDFEYTRNSNHKDADRVYRVMVEMVEDGRHTYLPYSFASEIGVLHPEIESVSLLDIVPDGELYLTTNEEDYIKEKSCYYADEGLFDVFTFPLKFGSQANAFSEINNVVISANLSEILFKDENPIGKSINVHKKGTFQVSGVFEDVPSKSLLNPGIVFTREQMYKDDPRRKDSWVNFTHVKVMNGVDQYELEENLFRTYKNLFPEGKFVGVFSENLNDTYWGYSYADYAGGAQNSSFIGANKALINTVGYVALGILLCAIVGYLSLSLGLSLKRSKEIGVRKVNGANRKDIQQQLLSESIFYAFMALLTTIVSLELTGDYFTKLFGVPIGIDYSKFDLLIELFVFTLITGILAGLYPAFVISKLNPVKILTGYNGPQSAGFGLKRVLLIIQLVVTIILVFGTVVQIEQVKKMRGFDFGYNKESLLAFQIERDTKIQENYTAILNEIQSLEGVKRTSGGPFPYTMNGYRSLKYDKGDTLIQDDVALVLVANNYFDLMDIDIVEGNSFTESNVPSIYSTCVINEALAKQLGDNIVGQVINFGDVNRTIIGVAKDYTDWGLSSPDADPRVFVVSEKNSFHSILIKHDGEHIAQLIRNLEAVWRSHERVISPEVINLETKKDWTVDREEKATTLTGFLSTMVLVLSLLNLLGYSVMYAGSKLKNISIRRILGAESLELFLHLVKPFFTSLGVSLTIALPIAYWLMNQYLNDYAVRIDLNPFQAAFVSSIMFLAVLLVVGFQLLKTSRVNPIEKLKE